MNGYKVMADSYRKLAEQGEITQEQADMECRIFDFLATCDDDDICRLFDSSAFNSIAKAYLKVAVTELTDEGIINEDQAEKISNRFSVLFEEKKAKEVVSFCKTHNRSKGNKSMVIDVRGKTIKETRDNIAAVMKAAGRPVIPTKCEKCGAEGYVFDKDILDEDGYTGSLCDCGGRIKKV